MLLINVHSWAIPTILKLFWFVHWTWVFLVRNRQSFSPFWTIILGTFKFLQDDLLTDFQGIQYLKRDQIRLHNHLLRVLYFPHSCDSAWNLHVIDIVNFLHMHLSSLLMWRVHDIVCSYECKLCLTLHNNEGNYLAHTQGKRHQTNLAKRAAREAKDAPAQPQPNKRKVNPRKTG